MRKLMFTLSTVNAVLNALVIGIFMPKDVIVLYGIDGLAKAYGSRWFYLIFVAVPLIISGGLLIAEKLSQKDSSDMTDSTESDSVGDRDTSSAIEDMLGGKTLHSDNVGMICTWFFAIISWVMTGIALNNMENIGVILPSIIVVMFSAATIFLSSIYSSSKPNSIVGFKLKWLEGKEELSRKAGSFSLYAGVMSGMLGVCLAAWSLVISNNLPNCLAIIELVLVSVVSPIVYSYMISKGSH